MKISIITVCYNSASTIADTIASVANQDYNNIEHIIIDGGSTDGTVDIIAKAPSVTRFVSEPDNGIYDAMNKGIAMASGDVVGILNSDDFYAIDNAVSQVAEAFKDQAVDACYADLIYVDQADTNKVVRYWRSRPFIPGLFRWGWMPAHPTFFVRRKYFDEFGCYDLNYRLQSDFELTMRFLEVQRLHSVYLPVVLIKMRMGGATNQSLKNIIKGNIEAYRACKKNHLKVSPLFILFKMMSRLPQFWSRPK